MTRCLVALRLALLAALAQANTLRWAGRSDIGTMDPRSFNEGLTDNIVGQIYEQPVRRNRQQRMEPAMAESWTVVNDTTGRFTARAGVKFPDGSAFTAADAVFSVERAQQASSQQAYFARQMGKPVLIDERTFELRLDKPNPLPLEHHPNVRIMGAAWCKTHGAARVPDFAKKEEARTTRNAMGTGPFAVERFRPGIRITLAKNPAWWDRFDGNVTRMVYTPIGNDNTRIAALLSGDIDVTHDRPPQDLPRLQNERAVQLAHGPENRVLFFVMGQFRDELLYASVTGRNPFKDLHVREAFALAINADALKTSTMRGQSVPTGCLAMAALGCLAPELEKRPATDPARAACWPTRAMPITLDCPNDGYVNDQAIRLAAAAMLAGVGVKVRVDARPKTIFFQNIECLDTGFYMLGWGGGPTDAQGLIDPIVRRPDPRTQEGGQDYGKAGDEPLDALIDAAGIEMNTLRRSQLISDAQRRAQSQQAVLPIHSEWITGAARRHVTPVVMPGNEVRGHWIRVD